MLTNSGGSRKFWWGGDFKHKTSKIRMSSPILRLNFRPNSKVFFAQNQVVSKKKKKKVFADFETAFAAEISNSKIFFAQNQVVSKKKKKKVFTEIESDFSAEIVRLRLVGGDASPNGAELFQIEADFSAEIVTFSWLGGMHPPPPPLNPPLLTNSAVWKRE